MLMLFFLFASFRILQGAPLATDEGGSTNILLEEPVPPYTAVVFGTRTTSDIVISCLATIFACTWTAVHPNIPSPTDSWWIVFKRRMITTTYALLTPELITLWAFRQFDGAKRIAKEYNVDIAQHATQHPGPRPPFFRTLWVTVNEWAFGAPHFPSTAKREIQPWTTTHGFFVQMGGFMLCENGKPIQAISFSKAWVDKNPNMAQYMRQHKNHPCSSTGIKEAILAGVIEPPQITKAEIDDRSKGDILSKTFVVLQTTWFIIQCVARWSIENSVTELELITLGFAMLNGITYALWWNKPQNVGVPVYLEINSKAPKTHPLNTEPVDGASITKPKSGIELPHIDTDSMTESIRDQSYLPRKLKEDWSSSTGIQILWTVLCRIIVGFSRPLSKLSGPGYEYVRKGDLRVSMFFAEPKENGMLASGSSFILIISTLFGCAHLIPSFFIEYPSRTEMWLWRIFGTLITAQPSLLLIVSRLDLEGMSSAGLFKRLIILPVISLPAILGIPLYLFSRLALITLAFLSLRILPPNAHLTIDWLGFIPHL